MNNVASRGVLLETMNKLDQTKKIIKDRWDSNTLIEGADMLETTDEIEFDPVEQLIAARDRRTVGVGPLEGVDAEFRCFENMPRIKRDEDRQKWWMQHKTQLPILFGVAQEVLSVPSSSAKSERVFSSAGQVGVY